MLTRLKRASEVVVGTGSRFLGLGGAGLLGVRSDCLSETYFKSLQFDFDKDIAKRTITEIFAGEVRHDDGDLVLRV